MHVPAAMWWPIWLQDAQKLLGRSASQAAQECEDIMACTLPPGSAGASPAPAPGPREPEQASPSASGAALNDESPEEPQQQRRRMDRSADMEDLGGDHQSRPMGPHHGRSTIWDGGTAAAQEPPRAQRSLLFADVPGSAQDAAAAAATPGRGMGVFEGISHEDDDFDWGALGTLRKGTPAVESARQIRRRSLPVAMALDLVQPAGLQSPDQAPAAEGDPRQPQQDDAEKRDVRDIQQTDGAADDSCSEMEEEPDQAAPSRGAPARAGSQRTGGSGSQQRYAALPMARPCGSAASVPAAPQRREHSGPVLLAPLFYYFCALCM